MLSKGSKRMPLVLGNSLAQRYFYLSLFLVLLPLPMAASGDDTAVCAQAVFCSGFEEGTKAIWDDYDGNPDSTNLIMEDPGPTNTPGNQVMRIRVPTGAGGADLVKVLPSSHDKLYARWYQKWEPGYDFSAANHGGGLNAGGRDNLGRSGYRPTGADWFSSWIEPIGGSSSSLNGRLHLYTYYRGMYQDCANPNGQCYGDSLPCMWDEGDGYCTKAEDWEKITPPQLETGGWYCIEMMIDAGTPVTSAANADGVQNFWLDGIEYGPWTNRWHRTTSSLKLDVLWLSLYHHGEHSVEGIMLDNVVVSTTPIGCLNDGLQPPRNLRVVK